jgi:hypothetical protein
MKRTQLGEASYEDAQETSESGTAVYLAAQPTAQIIHNVSRPLLLP